MNFYLGVRNSPTWISNDDAVVRYRALSDEKSVEPKFDDQVYALYSRLISHYPGVVIPSSRRTRCFPWACALDVSGDHMIKAIQLEKLGKSAERQ